MKIEDIRYSKYLSKNSPGISLEMEEKIDDLTRYLRLSAEFGCPEEGEKLYEESVSYTHLEGTLQLHLAFKLVQGNQPLQNTDYIPRTF